VPTIDFAGFVGPAYEARSRFHDGQRCINWYPEVSQVNGAKVPMALYPPPGLETYINVPTLASIDARPVRLLYSPPSRPELLIAAVGPKLVTFLPSGASYTTTVNSLNSNVGQMRANDNGTDILITDGVNGYTLNIAALTFAVVTDGDFYSSSNVAHLDGYFVLNKPGTAQFYWSDLRATTFSALSFATKEAWPDDLVTVWAEHRELWLIGRDTTEVWYSSGDSAVFARNDGVFLQHGCAAAYSVSRVGETFAFLSTDERGSVSVVMANGYNLQKISTQAMDYEFSTYEATSDAFAFTHRTSGHEFYVITFPTADKTWVYDVTTGMWHERASMDDKGVLHRHRANCTVNYRGLILVGDYLNGLIYEYKEDVYTDNGAEIPRIRRTPHIISDRNRVRYQRLVVEFEPGVGLQTGQGSDPQAMLRWSNDGGSTWSSEHWLDIGEVGKYDKRASWRHLGVGRDRVFEVRVSDPVKAVVIGATLELEPLGV
jgi:Phage stabilisation protein